MTSIFSNRNFMLLWIARLVSRLGDWLLDIALPILVYNLTGSAVALGGIVAVEVLPTIFLAPFAGALVDRVERKKVLTFTNILLGLSVLLLLLVRDTTYLPIIYVVAVINSCLGTLLTPAQSALLPEVVPDHQLTQANSVMALTLQTTRFVGPMLGGIVLAVAAPTVLFTLDAISFLLAALLVASLKHNSGSQKEDKLESFERKATTIVQDIRDGFAIVWQSRALQVVIGLGTVMMLSAGVVMTVLLVFVVQVLKGTESTYGYILSAQGAGMIVGGILTMTVLSRYTPATLFTIFSAIFGLLFLVVSVSSNLLLSGLGVGGMGLCMAVITICTQTLMQTMVPNEFRGRVFATIDAVTSVAVLLGAGVGGVLTDIVGVRTVLILAAIIACVAACIPVLANLPRLQQAAVAEQEMQNSPTA